MKRLVWMIALLAIGCSETPPTRFYTLAAVPVPAETDPVEQQDQLLVALAPIGLPAYLERPQFVVRLDETRMQIADFDSWIEPLDGLIQRVLASNLEIDPGIAQVVKLPQRRAVTFDRGIEISIDQFEVTAAGTASLDADWLIVDRDEVTLLRARFSQQVTVGEPSDFAARSRALSGLLAQLAQDIRAALATNG